MNRALARRIVIPSLAFISLTGCTPKEIRAWVDWYETDPSAAVEFAQTPEIQARMAEADPPDTRTYVNNHAARWEAIAWCESGRNWHLRATNSTGSYGGGLMIRDNVWRAYGGTAYASTADRASKEQQIDIAERILADVGWGAWDCA